MMRFLLLQVRDAADPMLDQERRCFRRAVDSPGLWRTHDLLSGSTPAAAIDEADIVFIGGSGKYSVVSGGDWLGPALETMRELVARSQPTFASCWGFQALAAALGGRVVTDLQRAEVGALRVRLTSRGAQHPLFAPLAPHFDAFLGHQDIVEQLPPGVELLASTDGVPHQAICFRDKPICATQFHPELSRSDFLERIATYPEYIRDVLGVSVKAFSAACPDTPEAGSLLARFVSLWRQTQRGDIRLA